MFGNWCYLWCLAVFGAFFVNSVHAKAKLRGQGFTDVTIRINDDVPWEKAEQILSNLETLIKETSVQLYKATKNRDYLQEVKIQVPAHWESLQGNILEALPQEDVDIVVTNHDVAIPKRRSPPASEYIEEPFIPEIYLRHGPRTIQASAICGRKGSHILIPSTYVQEMNDPLFMRAHGEPGKLLGVEWAKYQWGIYDEHGYPNDHRFPLMIRYADSEDKNRPNGCQVSKRNIERKYINLFTGELCSKKNPDDVVSEDKPFCYNPFKCMYFPNDTAKSTSPTSLLHQPFWPKVLEFCEDNDDGKAHDTYVVTPQNLFCERRSVWNVLNSHPDFQGKSWDTNLTEEELTPEIKIYRPMIQNIIFAVDVSSSMNATGLEVVRTHLRSSLRKIVRRGIGVQVGLVIFARDAREAFAPRPILEPGVIESLVEAIPTEGKGPTCIDCAIDVAVTPNVLLEKKTEVIFITDGHANELQHLLVDDPNHTPVLMNSARAGSIRVHGIFYGRNPKVYQSLAAMMLITGTQPYVLPVGREPDATMGLYLENALAPFITGSTDTKKELKTFEARLKFHARKYVKKVPLPESMLGEQQLRLIFTYEEAADFKIKGAFIRQGIGRRVQRTVASTVTHLEVARRFELTFNASTKFAGPATLQLFTEGFANGTLRHALPGSPAEQGMLVTAWVGSGSMQITEDDLPIDIYARVMNPSWEPWDPATVPLVLANITGPEGAPRTVILKDDGLDPDYKAADGVFSGYLVNITESGNYYLNVHVYHPTYMAPKAVSGGTIKFSRVGNADSAWVDKIAPSRITDLKVVLNENDTPVGLTWTAPGDDANVGIAREYVLEYFTHLESQPGEHAWKNQTRHKMALREHLPSITFAPMAQGSQEYYDFSNNYWINLISKTSDTIFFVLRAVDEAGNIAKMSNIAVWMKMDDECYMPPTMPPIPTTGTQSR